MLLRFLINKIILEKINTLKIQSDNMGTETHRGYCTTEPETTNKGKKVAWFTFWDNDFADKVELDLSNRELIQEDGKWFVVKKKSKYPKTYKECCDALGLNTMDNDAQGYKDDLIIRFQELLIARDAYWKISGEQMGLDKPWEPDWLNAEQDKFVLYTDNNVICSNRFVLGHNMLAFPTEEIRDTFYESFKYLITECKDLL